MTEFNGINSQSTSHDCTLVPRIGKKNTSVIGYKCLSTSQNYTADA